MDKSTSDPAELNDRGLDLWLANEKDEAYRVLEWAREITPPNPLPALNLFYLNKGKEIGLGKGPSLYLDQTGDNPVKVSVICHVSPDSGEISTALQSCLDQSFHDFEVLVINDGTEAGFAAQVAKLGSEKLRHVRIPHSNISKTMNIALSLSTGQYIAFIEPDAIYQPDHLETLVKIMDQADDECMVVYSDVQYVQVSDGETAPVKVEKVAGAPAFDFSLEVYLRQDCIPQISMLIKREAFVKAGGFNEGLAAGESREPEARLRSSGKTSGQTGQLPLKKPLCPTSSWDMGIRLAMLGDFKRVAKPTAQLNINAEGTNKAQRDTFLDNTMLAYYGGGLLYSRAIESKGGSYDRFIKALGWLLDKNSKVIGLIPFRDIISSSKYYEIFYGLAERVKKDGDPETARDLVQAALRCAPMEPKLWMKRIIS